MSADHTPAARTPAGEEPISLDAARIRGRRLAWIYAFAAAVLIPWIVYLAVTLPRREVDTHYRGAWVGFDVFLVAAIVHTAYYAFKVDTRVQLPAMATATLLLVDAWFDVMTAHGGKAVLVALVMAFGFELPAAAFSLYLARQANHRAAALARYASLTGEPDGYPP